VLDRDLPKGLWGCLGDRQRGRAGDHVRRRDRASIGISEFFSARLSNPKNVGSGDGADGFWPVAALFRTGAASAVAAGEKLAGGAGVIKLSGLDEYRAAPSKSGSRGATMYERKVSFNYHFKDIAYTSVHGSFSSNSRATSRWVLRLFGMDFQEGASVQVWVNRSIRRRRRSIPASPFGLAAVADRSGVMGRSISDRDLG